MIKVQGHEKMDELVYMVRKHGDLITGTKALATKIARAAEIEGYNFDARPVATGWIVTDADL